MDTIPTGFRFCPSDKVLLSYYLLKKLKGEPTEFQIPDVDVYGIEPWSLFNDDGDDGEDDDDDDDDDDDEATYNNNPTYVFTTIKKKHGNNNESNRKKKKHGNGSERISRTVTIPSSKNQVIGTWKDQKAQDIIDTVSKQIIGVKRMLSFMPAPSKQDHDDEDNEGTSNKRKRNHQLDGISFIMHEFSMAGSPQVLCRIRRKVSKSRKMNNKKMKYSSSCSKNITRKNTCWDDQGAEYDQSLHGSRMPYEDDHHQMMTNTSVLVDHNQSSMSQQQQQQDQDAEYNQQVQECMPQMMMNTSVLVDHNQSSMSQQQQQEQDAEYNQLLQGRIPYDDHHQIMVDTSVLDHDQSSMWQPQQPDQDAEHDQLLQGRMTYSEMMNAPIVLDENGSSMRQQQQQPVQSEVGVTSGSPILTNDDKDAGFDLLLDNTTSTSSGTGHEEVEEEDLRNQQQQPPAPEREEENLYLLSSIDFEPDDSSDFGNNLFFPERLMIL